MPKIPLRFLARPALGLAWAFLALQAAAESFELFEIKDSALVAELWKAAENEGRPPDGNYQVLVRGEGEKRQGFLLREGTQAATLPEFTLSLLQGKSVQPGEEEAVSLRGGDAGFWRGLRNAPDSLLAWAQWPTGLKFNWQSGLTGMTGASMQMERRLDFTWTHRPHPFALAEFGLHRSQFGGGLYKILTDPADTANLPYWSAGSWWWHAAVGVPGLKWEIALADRPLPEFYWIDDRAAPAARGDSAGTLIRQWDKGPALPGNFSQALHARLGVARYAIHFDGDAYSGPVQQVLLEDLPAPFGPWGFGFVFGGAAAHTRLRIDLVPMTLGLDFPRRFPSRVRFGFLRLDLSYRNKKNFHLSLATAVSLDNPALRWPGGKP